jgi:hypothetical protein
VASKCWLERQEVAGRHVLVFCQHVDSGLKSSVRTKGSQLSDAVVTDSTIFAPAPGPIGRRRRDPAR